MSVNEYGEIGCCVELIPEPDSMIVEWRIRAVGKAAKDNPYFGWKAGETIYNTSRGWIHVPDEQVFMPKPRERSLRPCVLRAIKYAQDKWGTKLRMETH